MLVASFRDCSIDFNLVDVRGQKSINWEKGENELASHLSHYCWGLRQNNVYGEGRRVVGSRS